MLLENSVPTALAFSVEEESSVEFVFSCPAEICCGSSIGIKISFTKKERFDSDLPVRTPHSRTEDSSPDETFPSVFLIKYMVRLVRRCKKYRQDRHIHKQSVTRTILSGRENKVDIVVSRNTPFIRRLRQSTKCYVAMFLSLKTCCSSLCGSHCRIVRHTFLRFFCLASRKCKCSLNENVCFFSGETVSRSHRRTAKSNYL